MKVIRIIAVVVLVAFIGIQFIPNEMPESQESTGSDLMASLQVSDSIAAILRNSCYDCHSFETRFPWYSRVAPSAWLLARDIREARKQLNFSIWGDYPLRTQIGKLDAIGEEVGSGDMPMALYTLIHRKARLNEEQTAALVKWTQEATDRALE